MRLSRSLFSAVALMAVATPAVAQLNPNATTSSDNLQIVSGGPFVPYGTYTGQLLATPGQPFIDVWCIDFNHALSLNNPIITDVTRLDASANDMNNRTRFGYNALDNYKKAAYLTQFFNGLTNATDVQDLHYAIWHVLNPSQPTTTRPGEAFWLAKLGTGPNAKYTTINTKYWFVLSDPAMTFNNLRNPSWPQVGGGQEMLTMVAPEPSAVLLVSTGLLGIVGLARIRRRGKKQD